MPNMFGMPGGQAEEEAKERYRKKGDSGQPKYMGHVDPSGGIGGASGRAGSMSQLGGKNYEKAGKDALDAEDMLRRRARGEESLSAEQLRQGLQQNVSAQRSMAAGAGRGGQSAAMRNAMINSARMGSGLAGQQALAGIAERQAAQDALTRAIMQRRGQDLQAGLGYGGLEMQGQGLLSSERLGHRGIQRQINAQPSGWERAMGAATGLGSAWLLK